MKIGDKFNELTVMSAVNKSKRASGAHRYSVQCLCSCGEVREVEVASLKKGQRSCGHVVKQRGEANPGWKGGKSLNYLGYVVLNGTKIDGKRYIGRQLEHRAVMEKVLGRKLLPEETVHHKNGVRSDNRPENLELWSSSHAKGQRVEDLVEWAKQILETYATNWD